MQVSAFGSVIACPGVVINYNKCSASTNWRRKLAQTRSTVSLGSGPSAAAPLPFSSGCQLCLLKNMARCRELAIATRETVPLSQLCSGKFLEHNKAFAQVMKAQWKPTRNRFSSRISTPWDSILITHSHKLLAGGDVMMVIKEDPGEKSLTRLE